MFFAFFGFISVRTNIPSTRIIYWKQRVDIFDYGRFLKIIKTNNSAAFLSKI